MTPKTIHTLSALLLTLVCGLSATGCAEDGEEARTPQALLSASSRDLAVGQTLTLNFAGVADQVVVFTGDKDHEYELRDSSNTGFVLNKGVLTYSYSVPGTFHVVCVATCYDTFSGDHLQQDTIGLYVSVTDMVTDIDAIYSTVTPNVYYATRQGDDWVMCLPTKQLYNNREMTVNATRQRLSIEAGSDSAKVFIDDEAYVSRNYYDLTVRHDLRVVSGSGATKDYRLYGMVYPEFATLTVDGAATTLVRSAYYQDLLTYQVAGDGGTLQFTLDDGVELLCDGQLVSTGSALSIGADYTLVRTHAENAAVKAVTRVCFNCNN